MEQDHNNKIQLRELIERVGLFHYGKSLRSKYSDLLVWIMNQTASLPSETDLGERVYIILNGGADRLCQYGNRKKFNTLNKGYRFCAHDCRCRREEQARKMINHHAAQLPEEYNRRVEAARQTMLANHGVENAMQIPEVRQKVEQTNFERYGAKSPFESKVIQTKIIETWGKLHGCHPATLEATKAKVRATNLKRYGTENTMAIARAAFAEQYGTANPFDLPVFQQKARQTMLERYGVEKPLQNPEMLMKMLDAAMIKYGVVSIAELPSFGSSISRIGTAWLNSLKVPMREYPINLGSKFTKADGYDPSTNTVYSFHGDFWHGNPIRFAPEEINARSRIPFGLLYEATLIQDELVRQLGYNLIVMWEADWKHEYRRLSKQNRT
jgi:hypothetical protein